MEKVKWKVGQGDTWGKNLNFWFVPEDMHIRES